MTAIADNLALVRERIALAAVRSGRRPEEITLVAATKTQSVEKVAEAIAAGAVDIGENYVQEAAEKRSVTRGGRWHMLGHLQTNKAKIAVTVFDLIQSVDSVKLMRAIGTQARAVGQTQQVLLQVHLGDEGTKFGFLPEEVKYAIDEIVSLPGITMQGLMGIAPFGEDSRPYFQQLRHLFDELPPGNRQILSMGMSGDFETAIEEGTTLIRIGTAIFGQRR